jgi:acetyl esterase/lipase
MQAIRAAFAQAPKFKFEPASRAAYDGIISQAIAPEEVTATQGEVGGVPGWWCRSPNATSQSVVLYLHGGGYVIGSASAYCGFAGQIAARTRAAVFVADYALAPERPYPAAMNEMKALYDGLLEHGYQRIALCGDSAGAGLVFSFLTGRTAKPDRLVGVVGLSPWFDLSLSGNSLASRADDDPILSRATLKEAAALYLGKGGTTDSKFPPLASDISSMPPVRIHVGSAEVLLDDSLRFAKVAEQAGLDCEVHVWDGMIHVFPTNFAMLQASAEALGDVGSFLGGVLGSQN